MRLLGGLTAAVLVPLLLAGVVGGAPWLARRVVGDAARRLPPDPHLAPQQRDRYPKAWLDELAARPTKLGKLALAIWIWLRAPATGRPVQVKVIPDRGTQLLRLLGSGFAVAGGLGGLVGVLTVCLAVLWSVYAEPEFNAAAAAGLLGWVKIDRSPVVTALFTIGASASVLGIFTHSLGECLRGFAVERLCHQLLAADPRLLAPRTRRNPHAWLVRVSRDVGTAYGSDFVEYTATPAEKERLCHALADLYRTYNYAWSDQNSLYLPEAQPIIRHCSCRGHAEHVSMFTAAFGNWGQRGQPGRRQG